MHASAPAPSALVGRDHELATLREHLTVSLTGRDLVVLIGGEAGIGKTTLAEALCREAMEQGALVLVGRCYDLAETPPYGPWIELFDQYRQRAAPVPLPAAVTERGTVGAVISRAHLHRDVLDFCAAVAAHQPLVLILDDLHWADPDSLDLLRIIGRQIVALPLLAIAVYRSNAITRHHPLSALLPALVREAGAARIDVRPLGMSDVRALIARRYGLAPADGDRLTGSLHARAEGNPFFLGELLRSLEDERTLYPAEGCWVLDDLARVRVPQFLRQVIDARLPRRPEDVQHMLGVAAVLGHDMPLETWAALCGLSAEVLQAGVARATAARIVEETPDGMHARFVHALTRETLYEAMAPSHGRGWHRKAGEILARTPSPDPDAVAYHFRQARDARAEEWLVKAGDRAQRAHAWLTAAARFEAALAFMATRADDAARGWLLYRLSRLYRFADPRRGLVYADDAARLATVIGDRALAACALYSRGSLHGLTGDLRRGLDEMEAGFADLALLSIRDRARLLEMERTLGLLIGVTYRRAVLALWLTNAGRYDEACVLAEVVVADDVPTPPGGGIDAPIAAAYHALAQIDAARGRHEEARRSYSHAREAYTATGESLMAGATARNELLWVLLPYQTERRAARRSVAAEGDDAWRRAIDVYREIDPALTAVPLLWLEGRWVGERESSVR